MVCRLTIKACFIAIILLVSHESFGQKVIRLFKKDLDVTAYQNKELNIKFSYRTADCSQLIIRSFFDSKDNKFLGYNTLDYNVNQVDDLWYNCEGTIQIPKKAANLDFAILTSSFPETILIADLIIYNESEEICNISSDSYFEIFNYLRDFEKAKVGEKSAIQLKIDNRILYGNNSHVGKYVNVNGIDFYYEIYGTGEPVLLLHGNNESINSYRFQIDKLKENYKVIAVDSRCQGRSSCDKTKLSYKQMACDMSVLLDSLDIDKVSIVGWSDGGNTGLEFALQYPEKVKSLITMGANLYPTEKAIKSSILKQFKNSTRITNLLGLFNNEMKKRGKVSKMCLRHPNLSPIDLKYISMPVLVMAGEDDIIYEDHTRLIAHSIPNSELFIFAKQGHNTPIDSPNEFNTVIQQFLEKIDNGI
ncbi:MAG: alpha/beta hydrolase [Carboxylicivirga sp.]|jgi:pimeloyl-ACP methyl ester carboxylesterase|nr:alpha/beta hydrolase [Carboxylicivirga sp.]